MRKTEANKLFGVALWGYALPKYKSVFIKNFAEEDNKDLIKRKSKFRHNAN